MCPHPLLPSAFRSCARQGLPAAHQATGVESEAPVQPSVATSTRLLLSLVGVRSAVWGPSCPLACLLGQWLAQAFLTRLAPQAHPGHSQGAAGALERKQQDTSGSPRAPCAEATEDTGGNWEMSNGARATAQGQ